MARAQKVGAAALELPTQRPQKAASWVLGLSAISVVALSACSRQAPAPESIRAVRSVVVAPGMASQRQEYAAEIRARTESRLGFRVGGKLTERPVQLGDAVRKGQVLARLDPQDLRLVEQAAHSAVQGAQINLEQSQADLKRFKGLFDQGFISAAELERRTSLAAAAAAQLDQAQAQASVQARQTHHSTLVADSSGVITAVDAEPGAVLAAGTPVVRLAWDGPRDAVFSVPEDRVAALRGLLNLPGALRAQLWGDERVSLQATLREVAAAADPVTRTFLVKAALQDSPTRPQVQLGQTAVVTVAKPSEAAIKLPLTALMQRQGQTAVWLLEASTMTVKVQPVRLASIDGNEAVLASGLEPGDEVVTAGVHVLTPGQKVKRESQAVSAAWPASAPAAQR